jgi:hypothetical protein
MLTFSSPGARVPRPAFYPLGRVSRFALVCPTPCPMTTYIPQLACHASRKRRTLIKILLFIARTHPNHAPPTPYCRHHRPPFLFVKRFERGWRHEQVLTGRPTLLHVKSEIRSLPRAAPRGSG